MSFRSSSSATLMVGLTLWVPIVWEREAAAEPALSSGGLSATAELGVAGVWASHCWTQLRVEVANRGEDFEGDLSVRGILLGGTPDPVDYRTSFDLPGRSVREKVIAVRPENWEAVEIRLASGAEARVFRTDLATAKSPDSDTVAVLAVGERLPSMETMARDFEAELKLSRKRWPSQGPPGQSAWVEDRPARCMVHMARPGELPLLSVAYHPLHLVILYNTSLRTARPEAVEALARWVEGGGTLVAFPGPEWTGGLPRPLEKLLGVSAGNPLAEPPPSLAWRLDSLGETTLYREILSEPSTEVVEGGLAVRTYPGAGVATTFTVTPIGSIFPPPDRACAGTYSILRESLLRAETFVGAPDIGLRALETATAYHLSAMTGFEPPGAGTIFLALVVYLSVGFWLPAGFFRKRRRREWTFAGIAASALLAIFIIYRFGVLSAIPGFLLEEVSVVRLHTGGPGGEVTSFFALISPSYRSLELEAPREPGDEAAAPSRIQPLRFGLYPGAPREGNVPRTRVETAEETGTRIARFSLYPNSSRFFRADYSARERLPVAVTRDSGNDEVAALRVENRSAETLELLVVSGDRVYAGPRLSPGDGVRVLRPDRDHGYRVGSASPGSLASSRRSWSPFPGRDGDWRSLRGFLGTPQHGSYRAYGAGGAGRNRGDSKVFERILMVMTMSVSALIDDPQSLDEFALSRTRRMVDDSRSNADEETRASYLVIHGPTSTFPGAPEAKRDRVYTVAILQLPPADTW